MNSNSRNIGADVLRLGTLIQALTEHRPEILGGEIFDAAIDSRQVLPGGLFIALPGERVDGHDFVETAFQRKAHYAIVQRDLSAQFSQIDLRHGWREEDLPKLSQTPVCLWVEDSLKALQTCARYWRRQLDLRVIGITGSTGKSTTKELIAEVLCRRYLTLKSPGNLNNEIGLPLTLLKLTPDHERAILEMGFYIPGEIDFLCDLALPQVGVVTNIGTVHAERAGSIEAIAAGKAELVRNLPASPQGIAILNYDDLRVREMAEQTKAEIFFYGMTPEADLWADEVEGLGLEGISFRMHYRREVLHLRVPLIGRHSVHTALRAASVGLIDGLTWQEIVDGLHSGRAQLRLIAVRAENGALILDDTYNASPESTMAALNLLEELEGRKVAVLGDMLELGQYEKQGHEMVGVRVAHVADELVTIGDRGRLIAKAARLAGMDAQAVHEFEGNQQAIDYLHGRMNAKDIVLVKGSRGMQMEEIVAALEEYR